ncbi:glycoside hydrolase family 2 protein [Gloeophyllum trabeum ATCC 11539]|uniref:Beta-mannosidase A n=1 Tax=Gloeophyllum trabeum (strain ATCC 11539 / FP-39264 / Madison 617) TaxID=670483 RepID=S7RR95_GLOTA|nr:glycoside hydrolase family 2 protein [Gloeophyllum trabeum ATCC 11539]EPQ57150.1 glycoside hydrolase family 2 protein [Gloeophyllum trabeum ATCC 11539]
MAAILRGLAAACLPALALGATFDLSGLSWTLKNANGSIAIPGSVPSQAHLDLLKAGVISEPLLGINDDLQRWIVNDNWTYTADLTPFTSTYAHTPGERALLVFYGLDTIANITLAGNPVAWVNNQFRQYVFDITEKLASPRSGDNNLTVAFESAWYYGLNVTSRPDAEYFPNTANVTTVDNFEYPGVRQYIRKIDDDFGWDWGPAFVPSGIFKPAYIVTLLDPTDIIQVAPIELSGSDIVFLEESSIDIYKPLSDPSTLTYDEAADWNVNVTLALRSALPLSAPTITLSIPELNLTSDAIAVESLPGDTAEAKWVTAMWTVPEGLPQRWYTHDLATGPKLYNLTVTLDFHVFKFPANISLTRATGFRTIRLAQTAYSPEEIAARGITPGDQWHFEINGMAFYSKGTNIIPFDPFYSRITTEQVRWVLQAAVLSGQNMLRVWGGGMYQPSSSDVAGGVYSFYSLCDELGILAWSELIFSDTLYPINPFLLENIEPEVRQNVRRVNTHPSNAQWAGGNEIEGIVLQANYSLANGTHYLNEFVTLFQDFLYGIVTSETESVPYTDCSTTHGVLSLEPYVLRFLNATPGSIYGNSERYNYDASQAFNLSTFPVSRFVNEFGFHSMPSFYSWEEVLENPEDFNFNSTVVMSRDHHPPAGNLSFPNPNAPQGQYQMTQGVELWLPTPGTSDSNQTFAQWCYSTQIFQSMTMAAQIAFYRRGAGFGENNLGSLVWQLNDIWQGVSWSAVEYSGRWKVLNYGLANVYSPVIISSFWTPENGTLDVMVTSDRWTDVSGTAQLTWFDWTGKELNSTSYDFTVPSLNNTVLLSATGLSNILPAGSQVNDVFLLMNLTAQADNRTVTNEQYFTPASLANAALVDPQIRVVGHDNYTFELSALGGVAPWTWIDHPAGTVGYFVDTITCLPSNGFYLIPGRDRTVQFMLNPILSKSQSPDPAEFVVRSVWNNTHV